MKRLIDWIAELVDDWEWCERALLDIPGEYADDAEREETEKRIAERHADLITIEEAIVLWGDPTADRTQHGVLVVKGVK